MRRCLAPICAVAAATLGLPRFASATALESSRGHTAVQMILELAFSGSLIAIVDMSPLQKMLSALSCGRWFKSSLFILELSEFPEHTLEFPAVQKVLNNYEISISDGPQGFFWLALMGFVFRFWTLAVLLLLKYSEGNTCVGRITHLVSKWLNSLGYHAILRPKVGDAIDSVSCVSRRPSKV